MRPSACGRSYPFPRPGDVLGNDELRATFGVGNMGGMQRSLKGKLLVLVSDYTKSVYHDS